MKAPELVIPLSDDSDTPLIGQVVQWLDDETCLVAWGDDRFSDDPAAKAQRACLDELAPWPTRRGS